MLVFKQLNTFFKACCSIETYLHFECMGAVHNLLKLFVAVKLGGFQDRVLAEVLLGVLPEHTLVTNLP
jgi:hypothetical protein